MLATTTTCSTASNLLPIIFENTSENNYLISVSPKILKIELEMEHFFNFESNPNHLVKSVFYKINYDAEIMTE